MLAKLHHLGGDIGQAALDGGRVPDHLLGHVGHHLGRLGRIGKDRVALCPAKTKHRLPSKPVDRIVATIEKNVRNLLREIHLVPKGGEEG